MKYTPLLTVLIAAVLALGLTACSPDIEEEAEETILTPEPEPDLVPDWVDGVLTITVGNYQTGAQILSELELEWRNTGLGISIDNDLLDPNFPMSHKQYTIEVAVIRMFDIGLDEPATYAEVYSRFRLLGYRPLTPEETMEMRLQFSTKDQSNIGTGKLMSRFFVLTNLSVTERLGWKNGGYYVMSSGGLGKVHLGTRYSEKNPLLDPATNGAWHHQKSVLSEVRFAVVKE